MKFQVVVTEVEDVAERVRAFVLEAPDGRALPVWTPGAHVSVLLMPPGGATARAYSLVGDPDDRARYRIAVQREPAGGGGSRFLHERVRPGTRLVICAPGNAFPLRSTRKPATLLAGGIGLTPFVPMARALARAGADVRLTVFARGAAAVPFVETLRGDLGARLDLVLGAGAAEGRAEIARRVADAARRGADLYHCGPPGFSEAVAGAAAGAVIAPDRVFTERFANPAQLGPGRAFRIRLAGTHESCEVPAGVSALDALAERLGLDLPSDCRAGYCGTCATRVVGGVPEHRDTVLSVAERAAGDVACLCVSRAATDELVIDP